MLICVIGTIILSLPAVQTKLGRYATDTINSEFGTNINVDRIRISLISWDTALKDVYVEDYKQDTLIYIKELSTSILSVRNIVKGTLQFGDIDIDGLLFNLKTYKGENDNNLGVFVDKLDDKKPRDPDKPPFFLSSADVEIRNSTFRLTDMNKDKVEVLNFTNLNIEADDFQILGPEVTAIINELSLKSKLGIDLKKLATRFKYTKQQMRFDSLQIQTPKSNIVGNLEFNYKREDLVEFIDKVNLNGNFVESTVALDEINQLYDQFGSEKLVNFSANVSGVLNDLNVEQLFLQSDNTGIRGDFNFKNIFTKETPFELNADIKNITTSYYELRSLLPKILGKSLPSTFRRLGQFTVRGDAFITETSIATQANLNTAIGSSYVDLALTDIKNIDNATYKGFVSLIDFDLGRFVENKNLGKTTVDVNVEGKGFVSKNLNTEVLGRVYSINFNNYDYKDLNVSGILKDQLFDGSLISNDENIKFRFEGLADFSADKSSFNFKAAVEYADLKTLNFINDSVSVFKGDVTMDITGSSFQSIEGDIKFTKTSYQNKNSTYYFEDFKIVSNFTEDSTRTIEINSPDIITGYMKGKFKVRELGKLVRNSIGSIYTNYKPFEISEGQELTFNFKIYNKIVEVFFPEVAFGPNTFIRGDIVADEGDFKLNFKSPYLSAYGNELDSIDVKIDNKNPLFNTYLSVKDVSTRYYDVKDFSLINTTLNDTLFFRTEFKGGSEYDDSYNLNFYHTFNQDNKSVIGLKKSDVSFKGNTWVLNRESNSKNKVIVNSTLDSIIIQEVVMNNDNREQIRLRGQLADSTYKDLELQFKLVSLNKIAPAIDSLKLKGEINGTLNVLQKDNVYLPVCNLDIAEFGINGIDLGDLNIGIVGNRDLSEFSVNSQIKENGLEKFGVFGKFTWDQEIPQADLVATFSNFNMQPFSPLGKNIVSNIRGKLNGNAQIKGDIRNPDIDGLLTMNNAGISVPYLNVDYDFGANSTVRLYEQTFDFQNIGLTDVVYNTNSNLDGTIQHQFFKKWNFDLDIATDQDRFLILNKEFEEEILYYGTGFVTGIGRIFGPSTALNIDFEGSTARGTSLKIPVRDLTSVGDYSFITFIDKNKIQSIDLQRQLKEYDGLELKFDLDVTPDAEVEIVVDQQTGSALKGTGAGLVFIEINTNGKFNMFGDFVVVTGEYNYKFGGIIDRTFKVKPGGSIVWDGAPLEAILDMEAVYSLNANPAPLLDNAGYSRRIPTDVVIRLTDQLERPTIDLNIEFPGTSSTVKSELEYRLQDPTIEERNAFFLLAQGTFVSEGSGINQQAVTGNLIQTASGLLNQVLSESNDKFDFGVSYEQGYLDPNNIETENRLGVTVSTQISDKVLFNGRFGVPVGGVSETVVAGDVEVQVLLNEEGTLRAKIFNRENEIQQFLAQQQGYTQGVGISYEVDFNSFKELMQKIFSKKEMEPEVPQAVVAPQETMGRDSLIKFYPKTNVPKL
ncbi:translocation/assembly module TamB domain-containing protein [uncultured Eudoraea sp.]|uniref:translocation/assembly module TamB domain-containing protein n=1 Tax=uncultured Eudoraea sp. TaxID=1035614 RepID=UPI0026312FCA|nr:translocation/assembly module TamB domain-containing protein [uncultured Eudoraea sp.]